MPAPARRARALITSPARSRYPVRDHAPEARGALGAPLKLYRKFSHRAGHAGVLSRLMLDT